MTHGQQLITEIRKLAGHNGPAAQTVSVSAPDGVELAVDVTAADSMSCSCRELRMRVPALNGADASVLKKWAEALCARVTYLLEQLGPLEIDSQGRQVLIRSKSPDKRDSATTFYEVLLQSQGAGLFTLRRFRRDTQAAAREHVDLRTTHEVLEKLADDLIATIPAGTN
jgi:hypothetical protein